MLLLLATLGLQKFCDKPQALCCRLRKGWRTGLTLTPAEQLEALAPCTHSSTHRLSKTCGNQLAISWHALHAHLCAGLKHAAVAPATLVCCLLL